MRSRLAGVLLVANVALLVATSEAPPESTGDPAPTPRCTAVALDRSFDVPAEGRLDLVIAADEIARLSGSLWLFADRERACRAQVAVGEGGEGDGGPVLAPNEGGDTPREPAPTAASWIPAGAAWEVPLDVEAGAPDVSIRIWACEGVVAEIEASVDACGEVRVEAQ